MSGDHGSYGGERKVVGVDGLLGVILVSSWVEGAGLMVLHLSGQT